MEVATTKTAGRSSRSLAPLGTLTLAALAVLGLVYLALFVIFGEADLWLSHLAIVVVLSLLVGAGFRWTTGLAAFVMGLLIVETLVFAGKDLTSPGDLLSFSAVAIMVAALVVGTGAGIGATLQNYRGPAADRRAPAWLGASLVGIVALVAGGIITTAVHQPQAVAGISPEALASLPSVSVRDFVYDQAEIKAKVGETVALRLENADNTTHYFEIDDLGIHATMPAGKSSLTVFRPTKTGTYTIYCTPHADKQAHTGMVSTLVVTE